MPGSEFDNTDSLTNVRRSDVPPGADDQSFRNSRWFTRGWTLQELLAPRSVEFFDSKWNHVGSKSDATLEAAIQEITGIPTPAIRGAKLSAYDIQDRIGWLTRRKTTREEDEAYCLFGLLGVFLPVIYGEGKEHAMMRLKKAAGQQNPPGAGGAGDKTLTWRLGSGPLLPRDGMSGSAPCFVEFEGDLIAMWRARDNGLPPFLGLPLPIDDHKLWWTTLRRVNQWDVISDPPKWVHQNIESAERPAIAAMQDQLVAVWKGVNHSTLYFSTLRPSNGAGQWAPPLPIPHGASNIGPSLTSLEPEPKGSKVVYALWNGSDNNNLYLSTYNGDSWGLPTALHFANTDVNSTLVAYKGKIVVSWKQSGSENLYWMFLAADGSPLMEPHEIGWEGTSKLGPTLAVVDGTLCAAWKGMGEPADVRVSTWRTGNDGFGFAQTVHNSKTRCAPTLASWRDTLVLAWRGDDWHKTMWWRNGELRGPH